MNPLQQSLSKDAALENELTDLRSEDLTLNHREMQRRVWIKERCEQIGKERLELFMERRKLYEQLDKLSL